MSEVRYMISDAAKLVDVEAHVLRYWEEELELPIGRNEMSHRYYTEENIRLFRHIKELKEQGVQLKAIKMLIPDLEQGETEMTHLIARVDKFPAPADGQAAAREEKMQQFQCIMSRLISEALEDHTERMGYEISSQVSGQVIKEMDYLLRMKEEREDERFKRLDEVIRSSQKSRKERALLGKEEKKRRGETGLFWTEKRTGRIGLSFYMFVLFCADSAGGTLCFAGSAIQAGICVDDVLSVALADSLCGTYSCTGTAGYTLVADYISHSKNPPYFLWLRSLLDLTCILI